MTHELLYRAGCMGFSKAGIPDNPTPHWYCSCGGWRINRKPNGSPHIETATKHWRKHLKAER
jgi:hypothetical protein